MRPHRITAEVQRAEVVPQCADIVIGEGGDGIATSSPSERAVNEPAPDAAAGGTVSPLDRGTGEHRQPDADADRDERVVLEQPATGITGENGVRAPCRTRNRGERSEFRPTKPSDPCGERDQIATDRDEARGDEHVAGAAVEFATQPVMGATPPAPLWQPPSHAVGQQITEPVGNHVAEEGTDRRGGDHGQKLRLAAGRGHARHDDDRLARNGGGEHRVEQ